MTTPHYDQPVLEFWYEFGSTYSYPAAECVEAAATEAGVRVAWRPFLLGPILASQGWRDSPFNLYPAKGRYMWRDLERRCARLGLPFRRPGTFPRNGLTAARVALVGCAEGWCPAFTRAVYRLNFVADRDIGQPEVLASVLEDLDLPAATVLARAASPEIKEQLRGQTETAARLGIFGAPTFHVAGELFWGGDRLDDALSWTTTPRPQPQPQPQA